MDEGELAQPCAVSFWTFAGPVLAGNIAMLAVGAITSACLKGEPPTTRQTALAFARMGVFWLVAGSTWVILNKRNGATT